MARHLKNRLEEAVSILGIEDSMDRVLRKARDMGRMLRQSSAQNKKREFAKMLRDHAEELEEIVKDLV